MVEFVDSQSSVKVEIRAWMEDSSNPPRVFSKVILKDPLNEGSVEVNGADIRAIAVRVEAAEQKAEPAI